jgi:hypothetical protein
MAENGYLYMNVPACNMPHSEPNHFYTGYTLMGILSLSKLCGYKILEAGQWGNKEYLGRLFGITGPRCWADYRMLLNFRNEIENPVIVWALLQRSS